MHDRPKVRDIERIATYIEDRGSGVVTRMHSFTEHAAFLDD